MKAIAPQIETIVGADGIVSWNDLDIQQRMQMGKAKTLGITADRIVYPRTQAELGELLQVAKSERLHVLPCGSGSKLSWGGLVPKVEAIVSTERINRLVEHAVGDLTVTVEAGMKLSQLEGILAPHRQFLALDPAYPESATIGGIIATADTGSWRQRYGGVRDRLIGISFVRSDGKLVKAGGRVVKNVAGYDLMKLLTGSYGTLGVICQATLRLYPLPEASGTVVLSGEADAIEKATRTLLNSALTPTVADLSGDRDGIRLIVRFQSIPESVKQQSARLLEVGRTLGLEGVLYADAEEANFWTRSREAIWKSDETSAIICKIGARPTAAVKALTFLQKMPASSIRGLIHARTGLGLLRWQGVRSYAVLEMRSHLASNGGFLTVLEAPVEFKKQIDVWGYAGNALEVMQRLKQQFDPDDILSPHRFVGGI